MMNYAYIALQVEKQGKWYKPYLVLKDGNQEKKVRMFCPSDQGLATREAALKLGEQALKSGRFV
jgi:hypothetical protein